MMSALLYAKLAIPSLEATTKWGPKLDSISNDLVNVIGSQIYCAAGTRLERVWRGLLKDAA
jgi:hypothetical protein